MVIPATPIIPRHQDYGIGPIAGALLAGFVVADCVDDRGDLGCPARPCRSPCRRDPPRLQLVLPKLRKQDCNSQCRSEHRAG